MLVAAEPSGDLLGAELARALRARLGQRGRLVGVGGERMAAEGVESPVSIAGLSILGVFDGLAALPTIYRRIGQSVDLARRERPDIAILIDSWGFNVRLAKRLRRLKPRPILIKYVVPQVWASRPWRARPIARLFDRLLALHSFDTPLYARAGGAVVFVGNPALARNFADADPSRLRAQIGAESGEPILLLLPGSRSSEVARLIDPFGGAAAILQQRMPSLRVVVAPAAAVADEVKTRVARWSNPADVIEGDQAKFDAMRGAVAAMACSGTVTAELAMAGCPMVVAYRMGPLSYQVARRLVTTPYITLLNVAAGRRVVPELIQRACTPAALAAQVGLIFDDETVRRARVAAQRQAVETLRGGIDDPIGAAADAVIEVLAKRPDYTPRTAAN
jgi:lipid-A-disaccharide synthase